MRAFKVIQKRALSQIFPYYHSLSLLCMCLFLPMGSLRLRHFLFYILSIFSNIKSLTISLAEAILSIYFRFCNLSPVSVNLDDQTMMHFWITNHNQYNKPNLVIVHGYGGNSRWQFIRQIGTLSRTFNLYVPDLLFFGDSFTERKERSDAFQAECVCQGLKRLGVERFSMFAISYGGFVGYRMAEMHEEMVEKVVIASTGIGCTAEQKAEQLKEIGTNLVDLLVPNEPDDYRKLVRLSFYKYDLGKWLPDFFLREYIQMTTNKFRKQKQEMVEYMVEEKADPNALSVLNQETLLIWGDKDIAFPLSMGHQLQRHLGPKSKLAIIKDSGHATNLESPHLLNQLIISFILGCSNKIPNVYLVTGNN